MNEGENSGMPNTPVFSSPNTSPNPQPAQPASPAESNASVIAAAASLPGEDPSQPAGVISSGDSTPAGARPRFGFTRKFKAKTDTQPAQTAFNNAPDYFNQAVGDIVIANENAATQKKKVKKIALIAVAALVVVGGGLAAFLLLNQASKPSANKVKVAFNRFANYTLYGEEKDSDIGEYSASTRYTIMDKYADIDGNYNRHFKELFDAFYKEYNSAAKNGLYEKKGMNDFKNYVYAVYYSFEMDTAYSASKILDNYISLGKEATTKDLEDKFEQYKKGSNKRYILDWHEARTEYINLLDAYASRGCFIMKAADDACIDEAAKDQSIVPVINRLAKLGDAELSSRVGTRNVALEMIWKVKETL